MSTLQTLKFIDPKTVYVHRMSMPGLDPNVYGPGAEITASCVHPHEHCLTISVVDGTLTGVEIVLNYRIRLDEANKYLGDPDYIIYQMLVAAGAILELMKERSTSGGAERLGEACAMWDIQARSIICLPIE